LFFEVYSSLNFTSRKGHFNLPHQKSSEEKLIYFQASDLFSQTSTNLQSLKYFPTKKICLFFFKRRKKIPQVLKKPTEKLGQQGFIMVMGHKNKKWHGCLMMEIEHSII